MKAVRQIIAYLRNSGVIGTDDLAQLAGKGFVDWNDVWQEEQAAETDEPILLPETVEDKLADAPAQRSPPKKGRRVKRKGRPLTEKGLALRLRQCMENWPGQLTGLVRAARRIAPCTTWHEASLVIRNATPQQLSQAMERGLTQRDPAMDTLWTAIGVEDYRQVLDSPPPAHGPVAWAFRAMLSAVEIGDLGRHTKLFHCDEVTQVFNLRLAQRKLLAAFEPVYSTRPDLIGPALQRDFHPVAYWAMVLVYNARRLKGDDVPPATPAEHAPLRPWPDDATWLAVWSHAMLLDPRPIKRFLAVFNSRAGDRDAAFRQAAFDHLSQASGFVCPRAWDWKTGEM